MPNDCVVILSIFLVFGGQIPNKRTCRSYVANLVSFPFCPKCCYFYLFQVEHFFRHRMDNCTLRSLNYLKQFPTPLISIVAKFVSFVSGGLAGILLILGFLGESILEGHVSTPPPPTPSLVSHNGYLPPSESHVFYGL